DQWPVDRSGPIKETHTVSRCVTLEIENRNLVHPRDSRRPAVGDGRHASRAALRRSVSPTGSPRPWSIWPTSLFVFVVRSTDPCPSSTSYRLLPEEVSQPVNQSSSDGLLQYIDCSTFREII
ncbi:unnamed protein product, partial [Amoebophrya sp. A25]